MSFVAISLGAAFGILSGRGAFAGMVSAGLIAVITSLLGGTRVQCSGPTAPMTALSAVVVAYAGDQLLARMPQADPSQFINLVLVLTGVLLVGAAVLRLGRYVRLVPHLVVSGFMTGIAVLIWVDQVNRILGVGGKVALEGSKAVNSLIAVVTFVLVLGLPGLLRKALPKVAVFLPSTLISIVAVSIVVMASGVRVQTIELSGALDSLAGMGELVSGNLPRGWSLSLVGLALPFAFQLAMLGYLDSLLTSLVVDRMTGERTDRERELAAQGLANSAVAFVGGIPGAQATIRSVLIVKEGATLRLSGVLVGVFVLLELAVFRDLIAFIPSAVFAGLLFKVGYDVFDWPPLIDFVKARFATVARAVAADAAPGAFQLVFIGLTAATTVLWNLNVAVVGFTLLFYALRAGGHLFDLAGDLTESEHGD